jgi:hypothetical protein
MPPRNPKKSKFLSPVPGAHIVAACEPLHASSTSAMASAQPAMLPFIGSSAWIEAVRWYLVEEYAQTHALLAVVWCRKCMYCAISRP